jgi:delta 1-pyrroline-5-carboxylate dehydrogenase
LERVVDGFGASFRDRSAVHLDLVQEATSPVWGTLPPAERAALLERDLPFLEWELRAFPLRAEICTGKTVGEHVRRLLGATVAEEGVLARVRWWVGTAELDGRRVGLAGWNYPLARPTGLGAAGERELGRLLSERLTALP